MKGRAQEGRLFLVYMHTNKIDNKKYVGITSKKPHERWKDGKGYKHNSNQYFYNAIQKYGWENFDHEILQEGLTLSNALKREFEISKRYNTTDKEYGYNGTVGRGGNFEMSEETRKLYSERAAGENNSMYGKKHTKETLQKLSDNAHIMKGKDNPVSRAVKGTTKAGNEIFFESANQAAKHLGLFNNSHIIECCKGKRNTCKGYKWEYFN